MRHPSKKLSNLSVGIGLDDKMPMIGGKKGDGAGCPQLFLGFHNPTDVFATCRRRLPNKPAHSKLSTTSELGSGTGTVFPNT